MLLVLLKVSQVMQDVTLEKTRLKKKKLAEEHTGTLCTMCATFMQIWNYSTIKSLFNKFTAAICDKKKKTPSLLGTEENFSHWIKHIYLVM